MANSFTYGGSTILSSPIFVETILPFLLVFTIVFAVLQKSKILGEGKRQIDAIVALVVGLLVISFGQAVGIIIQLTYFLAVSLVVILVLLILLGSFVKEGDFFKTFPKAIKWILIPVIMIAVTVVVLMASGAWGRIYDWIFLESGNSAVFANGIFIVIIVGAIVAVIMGAGKGGGSSSSN
jgi:hypothetical protein